MIKISKHHVGFNIDVYRWRDKNDDDGDIILWQQQSRRWGGFLSGVRRVPAAAAATNQEVYVKYL